MNSKITFDVVVDVVVVFVVVVTPSKSLIYGFVELTPIVAS